MGVRLGGVDSLLPVPALLISTILRLRVSFSSADIFASLVRHPSSSASCPVRPCASRGCPPCRRLHCRRRCSTHPLCCRPYCRHQRSPSAIPLCPERWRSPHHPSPRMHSLHHSNKGGRAATPKGVRNMGLGNGCRGWRTHPALACLKTARSGGWGGEEAYQ
jgi:hypothetical protein